MKENKNSKARTSKILGILACLLFMPLGIPAIILAVMSKEETGGVMEKDAKTGLTGGILALVIGALLILLYL